MSRRLHIVLEEETASAIANALGYAALTVPEDIALGRLAKVFEPHFLAMAPYWTALAEALRAGIDNESIAGVVLPAPPESKGAR